MTTDILKKKTGRYLCGESVPAERNQIQNWLSCTSDTKMSASAEERTNIEKLIVAEVKAYIEYTTLKPVPAPWWKKVTAFF